MSLCLKLDVMVKMQYNKWYSKKTKIETEAKVKEKIDKKGIVFRRTVTIKDEEEWY